MKKCSRCALLKDDSEFYNKHSACKKCVLQRQKEKYLNDSTFRERRAAENTARQKANPERCRDATRKCRYGITRQQYDMLLESQNGVCAICTNPETKKIKGKVCNLHVDHDHETNEIRGLLCGKCNLGIGAFNDDVHIMQRAIEYILRYKGQS